MICCVRLWSCSELGFVVDLFWIIVKMIRANRSRAVNRFVQTICNSIRSRSMGADQTNSFFFVKEVLINVAGCREICVCMWDISVVRVEPHNLYGVGFHALTWTTMNREIKKWSWWSYSWEITTSELWIANLNINWSDCEPVNYVLDLEPSVLNWTKRK